ncbi:hypothetical protein J5U18_02145 [Sphingobacteriaceae bacterium WQ 2009]|uniref:Uncharacterized protein n=1 Tax=Rhinopithecimicrobium faecis TaxID=2820698 RepID=A0A8T4H5Q3_9SPHI|nr:hypothetical protein [Sphingobacteriaceae bacterium WQ 2009]
MSSIIISGVIFMHKEITSTGEIITHIHPYNFGEKNKHQHDSDAQIRLLDVLYHGTYLEPSFTNHSFLAPTFFTINYSSTIFDDVIKATIFYLFLRGPPALAY